MKWILFMEPDRYQHSPKVYVFGILCMIISMALFGLGAYALPNIVFGLTYSMPAVVFNWITWIHLAYGLTEKQAGWWVLMMIFILGLVASIITYSISNRIETQIYAIEPEKEDKLTTPYEWRETLPLVLKILFILAVVFISAKLFHWVISIQ